jgi:hypothetical protein
VISVLDHRKGFGHTDLVSDPDASDDVLDVVGDSNGESIPARAADQTTWRGRGEP